MNRREFMGTAGIAAAGLAVFSSDELLASEHSHSHAEGHSGPFEQCAAAAAKCANHCNSCFDHCVRLVAEGKQDHVKTMRLCSDCSTICSTTAALSSRRGPLAKLTWDMCAEACETCAEACEAFPEDKHMAACAAACRDCAATCRSLTKAEH